MLELETVIKKIYDKKFEELDSHIEDIIKLNDLAIEATRNIVEKTFNKLFPIKK